MQTTSTSFLLHHILEYEGPWPPIPVPLTLDLEQASDEKLLKLVKQGTLSQRKGAFSAVYNRYYLDVWRFIRSRMYSEEDAKDIFGAVWCVALEKLPEFVWRGVSIKVWLIGIANNKMRELFREIEREKSVLEEWIHAEALRFIDATLRRDGDSPPADFSPRVKQRADSLLHKALSRLKSKHQRRILMLSYYEGLTSTEIGDILGIKPGTVRQNKKRALKKLRKSLS